MNLRIGATIGLCCFAVSCSAPVEESREWKWDIDPVLIEKLEPNYPEEAREAGVRGEVVLEIEVDTAGRAAVVKTRRPLGHGCTEAAIKAASQWVFKPALMDGEPAEARGIISVSFPPVSYSGTPNTAPGQPAPVLIK